MVLRPHVVASNLTATQARTLLHTISFAGFEADQVNTHAPPRFPPATLSTLSLLQIHLLTTFPFEALAMNYEPRTPMLCTLAHIYSRLVETRQGGGYCVQLNVLYRELLAFLRFRFVRLVGRVYSPISHEWSGFTHTTTLVYLASHVEADQRRKVYYLSDVGYASSAHRPILLRHGWEEFGRGSDKFRLIKSGIQPRSTFSASSDDSDDSDDDAVDAVDAEVELVGRAQMVWKLQQTKPNSSEWMDCYSFTPIECFGPDYIASNRATSHAESVPFATTILIVRYILNRTVLAYCAKWIQTQRLNPDLYPYHPHVVEQTTIVGDRYTVKLGDQLIVSTRIQAERERERVELIKNEFGMLSHVGVEEAVRVIGGKPSSLVGSVDA